MLLQNFHIIWCKSDFFSGCICFSCCHIHHRGLRNQPHLLLLVVQAEPEITLAAAALRDLHLLWYLLRQFLCAGHNSSLFTDHPHKIMIEVCIRPGTDIVNLPFSEGIARQNRCPRIEITLILRKAFCLLAVGNCKCIAGRISGSIPDKAVLPLLQRIKLLCPDS